MFPCHESDITCIVILGLYKDIVLALSIREFMKDISHSLAQVIRRMRTINLKKSKPSLNYFTKKIILTYYKT